MDNLPRAVLELCVSIPPLSANKTNTTQYKIPGFSDIPQIFNVSFLQGVDWHHLRSIQSSKGVGEPPLFLGATVLFALREALLSARKDNGVTERLVLDSPATAERLRLAVGDEILMMGTVAPKEGEKNFWVSVA